MKQKFIILVTVISLCSLAACQKAEEPKPEAEQGMLKGPIIDYAADMKGPKHEQAAKPVLKIIVPEDVQKTWQAVKFNVEDKKDNTTKEYSVNIGEAFNIPGSDLVVKTGAFLPDFQISGQIITSGSAEPGNPAIGVIVLQNNEKIFPPSGEWGWMYSKFPTIHSFEHERFAITLAEGIRSK
ncbi:MAG: hypothetical protein ISR96_02860 [Nitrospira sp.]|nr:hypothetical protein [bacterium]MBL7048455.1 hypothetical protein [Nitrospira sp.]